MKCLNTLRLLIFLIPLLGLSQYSKIENDEIKLFSLILKLSCSFLYSSNFLFKKEVVKGDTLKVLKSGKFIIQHNFNNL